MATMVTPKVFMIGKPSVEMEGLLGYLHHTGQEDFLKAWNVCDLSDGEKLVSFFAKLCYKSLVVGQNANIQNVRDIPDNLVATMGQGHGSVFEHCNINFVATDVSRVFTHELVRHRAGTAFSQTSGRYVRGNNLRFVMDPILDSVRLEVEATLSAIERSYELLVRLVNLDQMKDKGRKKKITSALRRILPNGQANEIGFTLNLRTLRHFIMVRSSRHSEWEIRCVAEQVFDIMQKKCPLMFHDARIEVIDGIKEISGMMLQPYESHS